MPNFVQYPRGFISFAGGYLKSNVSITQSEGDPQIAILYKLYIARSVNVNSWEFRQKVLAEAARLIGNFRVWVISQASYNDSLYGLNWEFLKDTLEYIQTGHRKMSVSTWRELLLEYPPRVDNTAGPRRLDQLKAYEDVLQDVLENGYLARTSLTRWLGHDGGFDDLITTLNVFFGSTKITPA